MSRSSWGWKVCYAADQCAPCRSNQHDQCSGDGEPDCLCVPCKRSGRARRNRAELERAVEGEAT